MYIDSHVHCRDEQQAHKETVAHALRVARSVGVDAIFDMPNTSVPVFNEERARDRLNLAKVANVPEVFYGTYIGLTADPEQVKQAVQTHQKLFPYVVGMKLYAGHSTGNLGVIKEEDQQRVYCVLAETGYEGILFVHAEKENEMNDYIGIKFDPANPISHCLARPWKAEYESVKDQIRFARASGFKGKLHIAHISHPATVGLVSDARTRGMDISCGVCPHHIIYDDVMMQTEEGLLFKMNPPLREAGSSEKMLQLLREGKINWIETDHAPHTIDEKTAKGYASGIPGLPWWPVFDEYLARMGFDFNKRRAVTFDNVAERFGIDIKRRIIDVGNVPARTEYAFNPFSMLEGIVRWK